MIRQEFEEELRDRQGRIRVISIILALGLMVLFARIFFLQVIDYERNAELSENNRIREIILPAERGIIYDRNGTVLVGNRPSYQVSIVRKDIQDSAYTLHALMQIKDHTGKAIFDSTLIALRIAQGRWKKYIPMRILEDAPAEVIAMIEERSNELPGVITQIESRREYPYGSLAAHALGYTGQMSPEEINLPQYEGYRPSDRVGKKGIEKFYEKYFRGKDGVHYVEVDVHGRRLELADNKLHKEPVRGMDLMLSIDLELQKIAEEAMPDSIKGALVAIDPQNGEILAMVSKPAMDPNIFSMDSLSRKKEWAEVALDPNLPLNNRAIAGTYPPGSTFKLFTSVAGIESGKITAEGRPFVPCNGGFRFGNRYQKCWEGRGHGSMCMIDANRESCDTYFYQLGLMLDMPRINQAAEMYGLGSRTFVDLPGEKRGLLMDSAVFNRRYKKLKWQWSRGLILNLAIGQGELVTPLQLANSYAGLGNGKVLWQPHFLKAVRDSLGKFHFVKPKVLREIKIKAQTQDMVIRSLDAVVNAPMGTGVAAKLAQIKVGGKTGSAENPHGKLTHALFGCVAPLDQPRIAIGIILENAGHGGGVAAPVAAKVLRHFFKVDSLIQHSKQDTLRGQTQSQH